MKKKWLASHPTASRAAVCAQSQRAAGQDRERGLGPLHAVLPWVLLLGATPPALYHTAAHAIHSHGGNGGSVGRGEGPVGRLEGSVAQVKKDTLPGARIGGWGRGSKTVPRLTSQTRSHARNTSSARPLEEACVMIILEAPRGRRVGAMCARGLCSRKCNSSQRGGTQPVAPMMLGRRHSLFHQFQTS